MKTQALCIVAVSLLGLGASAPAFAAPSDPVLTVSAVPSAVIPSTNAGAETDRPDDATAPVERRYWPAEAPDDCNDPSDAGDQSATAPDGE